MSQGPDFRCPLAGTGPIHLNEVQCRGTEKSLWDCPSRNITQEDCKHTEDAAVRCNIPYMGYENLVRTMGGCWLHGAPSSGASEWGAGKGPQDPWVLISPSLHPTHFPLSWELRNFVGGKPCEEGGGGEAVGALWVLLCEGRCGAAAPCCFSCCQPLPTPQQKHQKKNHCGPTKRDFFFYLR